MIIKQIITSWSISFFLLALLLMPLSLLAKNTNWYQAFNGNTLHIILCGTGTPAITTQYIRHPACLAVLGDKQFLLFDAGDGAIQTLGELSLPIQKLDTVFITHWHSDHFGGLGQVMNETWMNRRKVPLTVYGPYGVKEISKSFNKAYRLDAIYRQIKNPHIDINTEFIDPKLVDPGLGTPQKKSEPTLVYKKNNLSVSSFLVDHSPVVPALGYQVHFGNCLLVISGDTKVVPRLADYYKDADVLVSEAMSHALLDNSQLMEKYGIGGSFSQKNSPPASNQEQKASQSQKANQQEQRPNSSSYHSDSWELAKLVQKVGVKHLVLTHLMPNIQTTDEAKKAFSEGMSDYYKGPIYVANDKDQIEMTSTSDGCKVEWVPASQ